MSVARGQEGELMARAHLEGLGYKIIETNWRFLRAEIDLIATGGDEIIFVEVKRRGTNAFGYPEEYLTRAKARHLRRAIEGYLVRNPTGLQLRVDIIAITDTPFELIHIKAVDLP